MGSFEEGREERAGGSVLVEASEALADGSQPHGRGALKRARKSRREGMERGASRGVEKSSSHLFALMLERMLSRSPEHTTEQ